MRHLSLRFIRLVAVLGILAGLAGFSSLDAQSRTAWPKPAPNWWKKLKSDSRANYTMSMGSVQCQLVIKVDSVDGNRVTVTNETKLGESALRAPETKTVDCMKDPVAAGAALPLGANPRKVGEEALSVGSHTFRCQIYELILEGKSMKVWHTREIPPIFNNGNVRVETQGAVILMTSYAGPKLSTK